MTLCRSMVAFITVHHGYGMHNIVVAFSLPPPQNSGVKQKLELDLSIQPQSHHTHIHTKIRATSARKVQLSDGSLEPSI